MPHFLGVLYLALIFSLGIPSCNLLLELNIFLSSDFQYQFFLTSFSITSVNAINNSSLQSKFYNIITFYRHTAEQPKLLSEVWIPTIWTTNFYRMLNLFFIVSSPFICWLPFISDLNVISYQLLSCFLIIKRLFYNPGVHPLTTSLIPFATVVCLLHRYLKFLVISRDFL